MTPNSKIHFCWTIAVLTAIIIILLAVKWSGIENLANTLNFALTLTSLVLAVIAIIYAIVANNAFAGTVSHIEIAASTIRDMVKEIPDKLNVIAQKTSDMHQLIANAASPQVKRTTQPPHPAEESAAIQKFAIAVTEEFLRASSWNGLKLLYVCRTCCEKKIAFDLKQLCSLDGAMSYDYAMGYFVASASAQFLQFNTNDYINILVTFMPSIVADRILAAINTRIEFVGLPNRNDFQIQMNNIDALITKLQVSNAPIVASAEPSVQNNPTATVEI